MTTSISRPFQVQRNKLNDLKNLFFSLFLFDFYRMKNPTCWESWQSVWRNPVSRVNFLPKSLNDYDEDLSTTNEEVFDSVTMCVCLSSVRPFGTSSCKALNLHLSSLSPVLGLSSVPGLFISSLSSPTIPRRTDGVYDILCLVFCLLSLS